MSFKKKIKGLGAIVLAGSLVLNTGIFAGDIFSSGDQGFEPAATQNEDALPFVGSAEDQQADVFAAISSGVSGTEQVENGSDEVSLFASADFSQPSETDFVKSYLFVEKDTPAYLDANAFSEVGKFPEKCVVYAIEKVTSEVDGKAWFKIVYDTKDGRESEQAIPECFIQTEKTASLSELDAALLQEELTVDAEARKYEETLIPVVAFEAKAIQINDSIADDNLFSSGGTDSDVAVLPNDEGKIEILSDIVAAPEEEGETEILTDVDQSPSGEGDFFTGEVIEVLEKPAEDDAEDTYNENVNSEVDHVSSPEILDVSSEEMDIFVGSEEENSEDSNADSLPELLEVFADDSDIFVGSEDENGDDSDVDSVPEILEVFAEDSDVFVGAEEENTDDGATEKVDAENALVGGVELLEDIFVGAEDETEQTEEAASDIFTVGAVEEAGEGSAEDLFQAGSDEDTLEKADQEVIFVGGADESLGKEEDDVFAVASVSITKQPQNVMVAPGSTATFKVTATGTGLTYQWQTLTSSTASWTNTSLSGCKTATLSFTANLSLDGRKFRCIVKDSSGNSVTSSAATLTVTELAIQTQPKSITVAKTQTAKFTVAAVGTDLTYQWQTKTSSTASWINTSLSGCKTATLSFTANMSLNGRQFRVIVTNGKGATVTSSAAKLTVTEMGITTQPKNVTVEAGKTAKFTIAAVGTDLAYQWQTKTSSTADWINTSLSGCKTATLSFAANKSLNGRQFRCIVTDGNGNTATSNAATLTVTGLAITTHPANVTIDSNKTATFKVVATGTGLTYQWQTKTSSTADWINTSMSGCKTDTLSFNTTVSLNGRQFRCVVTDGTGASVTSNAATLKVRGVSFTTQPKNITVAAGATATFKVVAASTYGATLTYQWQTKTSSTAEWINTSLSGSKTATLSFTANSSLSGRQFRCFVTDSNGKTGTSSAATLTVTGASSLAIKTQPANVTLDSGQTATFKVVATGTGLTYQWQTQTSSTASWTNTSLSGCNTATLSFKATVSMHGRNFRCIVTDSSGKTVTSNAALLKVRGVSFTTQPKSITVEAGATATFKVVAASTYGASLTYQWQTKTSSSSDWINTSLSGCKTATLSFTANTSLNGRQFRCLVTDSNGKPGTSSAATLTVTNTSYVENKVTYKPIDSSSYYVAGYSGTAASLTIPEKVNGKTVKRIGASAFEGNTTLESIDLPDTIEVIEAKAFKNCTNLREMK